MVIEDDGGSGLFAVYALALLVALVVGLLVVLA